VTDERLSVLEAQQGLQTDAIAQMLQGHWVGFPSLEADLGALSPGIQLEPHPPLLSSEAGPPTPPDYLKHFYPSTDMPQQVYSWTCSACALDWVLRATQVAPNHTREQAVEEIGYPENINPTYGLMDANGTALRAVYDLYAIPTFQAWLNFDQVWAAAGHTTGQISGGAWYHWVAIRGQSGSDIWIANSAPGYAGVYDTLSRDQFNRLGPFSCVLLVP
jgi:hypothetical protein